MNFPLHNFLSDWATIATYFPHFINFEYIPITFLQVYLLLIMPYIYISKLHESSVYIEYFNVMYITQDIYVFKFCKYWQSAHLITHMYGS